MKYAFAIVFALAAVYPEAAFAVEWRTDLENALVEAEERGAPVFLFMCQAT